MMTATQATAFRSIVRVASGALAPPGDRDIWRVYPCLNTYLIHTTHRPAIPGAWLPFAAACGLGAVLLGKPKEV